MRKLVKRIGYTLLILFVLLNVLAAMHAYKFTHFYDSTEDRPLFKAEDAGFWSKSKAILFGIKSFKQPNIAQPSFPFDTVTITTDDGVGLKAWESRHACYDTISPFGTIIMFHGHGGNKAGLLKEAEAFRSMNYQVLMVDFRAHGNSQGNTCTVGYDESKDVKAAYDYVLKQHTNIIFYGISLGAATEMKAVKDYHLNPSKMILEMPFGSLFEAVKGRCRILGVPVQPTSTLLTFWGGVEQGFWAFDHKPMEYAKAVDCPVLLQWGEKDIRVNKSETEAIFKNLHSSNKQLVNYQNSGHQSLCTNENEKWKLTVSNFLKQ